MDTHISVKVLGGAADGNDLTGSCVLLTIKQGKTLSKTLIDVGLIQCSPKNSLARNKELLKELKRPDLIDSIVLTHAHTDHIGRLPFLVKHGFGGKSRIICTQATTKILPVMLEDSAKIQAESAIAIKRKVKNAAPKPKVTRSKDRLTRGNYDKGKRKKVVQEKVEPSEVLYDLEDVVKTCALIKNDGHPYHQWIKLSDNSHLKLYQSGHVLGGAICVIRVKTRTKYVYLGFSGDLGRQDGIILPPPEKVDEPIDFWFTESTYGGRDHPERDEEIKQLIKTVKAAIRNKQKIIIPSFALERAQEILYLLSYYIKIGEIPRIPIYLDAPMASKITEIFATNWNEGMFADQDRLDFNPFDPKENTIFQTIPDRLSSLALIKTPGPYIVIAGSGMCDAGRVRDHLRFGLSRHDVVVCLVGYMAENSLGRKLKDALPVVKMNGEEIVVKANIVCFDSFSAHADGSFLVAYAKSVLATRRLTPQKIIILHGEEKSSGLLKTALMKAFARRKSLANNIIIPTLNEEIVLMCG